MWQIFMLTTLLTLAGCKNGGILGHVHQLAHQILFLHDLGVGLHVGDAGHRLGQTGQVHLGFVGTGEHSVRDDRIQQGHKVDGLVVGE